MYLHLYIFEYVWCSLPFRKFARSPIFVVFVFAPCLSFFFFFQFHLRTICAYDSAVEIPHTLRAKSCSYAFIPTYVSMYCICGYYFCLKLLPTRLKWLFDCVVLYLFRCLLLLVADFNETSFCVVCTILKQQPTRGWRQ